jgi:hypothetical protein
MNKKYNELNRKYKKALKLLDITIDWACEIIGGDEKTMKWDSPTIYYVCKEAEKLN